MFLLFVSLGAASGAIISLIISLILLFIAAFIGPPSTDQGAPFYRRLNFGWAGTFFFVLSVALS